MPGRKTTTIHLTDYQRQHLVFACSTIQNWSAKAFAAKLFWLACGWQKNNREIVKELNVSVDMARYGGNVVDLNSISME